jgi:hypothetical protein
MIVANMFIAISVFWPQERIIRKMRLTSGVYGFLVLSLVPIAALCDVFLLQLAVPTVPGQARCTVSFHGTVGDHILPPDSDRANIRVAVVKVSVRSRSSIAVLCKVVRDVTCKPAFREWQNARKGESLAPGDRMKTGVHSFAVIKFEDQSMVRVRQRTELTITGGTRSGSYSRSIDLIDGVVGFHISKQRSHEAFQFTSPTSVASIRGTKGTFASADSADTLTVLEGIVVLTNTVSSEAVEVRAGHTGISFPTGGIISRRASQSELSNARAAIAEENEIPHMVLLRNRVAGRTNADAQGTAALRRTSYNYAFVADRGERHLLLPPIRAFGSQGRVEIYEDKLFSWEKLHIRGTVSPVK